MNKLSKLNTRILKGYAIFNYCKKYLSTVKDPNRFVGLVKVCKDMKISKNTAKLYLRLIMKSKLTFLKYFCIPATRSNTYPFELPEMIAKSYKEACDQRSEITNGIKTRITFKTFLTPILRVIL